MVSSYPPYDTGAPGSISQDIVERLASRGIEVHVLTTGPRTETVSPSKNLYIHWQQVPRIPLDRFLLPLRLRLRERVLRRKALNLIKGHSIDLITSMDTAGYFIAGERPTVTYHLHPVIYDFIHTHSLTQKIVIKLFAVYHERRLVRKSKIIVCDGSYVRQLFVKEYPWASTKTVEIPLGFDTDKFKPVSPSPVRQRYGIGDQEILLFHPGGARSERKGGLFLLDALGRLKGKYDNIKCLLTGEGREAGWRKRLFLPKLKEERLDNVILAGEVDYAELPYYYAAADIVLFPSIFEGGVLVPLEALSCAKPLICTNISDHATLFTNEEHALLIDAGDVDALESSIERLIADPMLRKRLGDNGRQLINEKLSIDVTVDRLIEVYHKVLGSQA